MMMPTDTRFNGVSTASTRTCGRCNQTLQKSTFSKSQWRKAPGLSACTYCTGSASQSQKQASQATFATCSGWGSSPRKQAPKAASGQQRQGGWGQQQQQPPQMCQAHGCGFFAETKRGLCLHCHRGQRQRGGHSGGDSGAGEMDECGPCEWVDPTSGTDIPEPGTGCPPVAFAYAAATTIGFADATASAFQTFPTGIGFQPAKTGFGFQQAQPQAQQQQQQISARQELVEQLTAELLGALNDAQRAAFAAAPAAKQRAFLAKYLPVLLEQKRQAKQQQQQQAQAAPAAQTQTDGSDYCDPAGWSTLAPTGPVIPMAERPIARGRRQTGRGQAAPRQAPAGAIDLSVFSPDDLALLQRLATVGMPEDQLVAMARWIVGCRATGTVGQKIPDFALPWLQAVSC